MPLAPGQSVAEDDCQFAPDWNPNRLGKVSPASRAQLMQELAINV